MRALLIFLAATIGTGALTAQPTTPVAGDDQARCKAGDLGSCVRSETTRCDAGDAKACVDLSGRYFGGVAVSRDTTRGRQLYERAFHLADSTCAVGDLSGCAIAGLSYGFGPVASRDLGRAKTLEERACAGGNADGCFILGYSSLLGMMGIARDSVGEEGFIESRIQG
jgi:TPR repeat protein